MKHLIIFAAFAAALLQVQPAQAEWTLYSINYDAIASGGDTLYNATASGHNSDSGPEASVYVSAYYDGRANIGYGGTIQATYVWSGGGTPPSNQIVGETVYVSGYADTASYALGSSASASCASSAHPQGSSATASGGAASASFQVQDDPRNSFSNNILLGRTNSVSGGNLILTMSFNSSLGLDVVEDGDSTAVAVHGATYTFP